MKQESLKPQSLRPAPWEPLMLRIAKGKIDFDYSQVIGQEITDVKTVKITKNGQIFMDTAQGRFDFAYVYKIYAHEDGSLGFDFAPKPSGKNILDGYAEKVAALGYDCQLIHQEDDRLTRLSPPPSKSTRILLIISLLALIVGNGVRVVTDSAKDQGLTNDLTVIAIALGLIGLCIATIGTVFKRKEKLLQQVRARTPVAYMCTVPLSNRLMIVAVDGHDLVFYKAKRSLPEIVRFDRKNLEFTVESLPVSAVRNADGVVLKYGDSSEIVMKIFICKDALTPVSMPPLRQPDLSVAIERLSADQQAS